MEDETLTGIDTEEEILDEEVLEESEDDESEEPEAEPFEIEEPKVRKTPKDYILERRSKRLEKYESMKQDIENDDYDDNEEDEDDVKSIVAKEIQKALRPLADNLGSQSFNQELAEVISKYPELKGKEDTVKKYAEAYPTTPLEFLAQGILFKKYNQTNAREEAQSKAKSEQKGGNIRRPKEVKEKNAWDMTEAEFLETTNKVRSGTL